VRFVALLALHHGEVDALREGEQGERVAGIECVHEAMRRGLELGQRLPCHAGAGVEREHGVDRGGLASHHLDRLGNAVVEDLEVRGGEVEDRRAVAGHRHVEPHHFDPGREHGHLGGCLARCEEQQQ
jgi:hypothetical protein